MNPLIRAALKMVMLAGVMKGAEMMATRGADPNDPNDPQTREAGRRARRNTAMTMRLLNTLRRTLKF